MENIPEHLGVIIDGNRRWAREKNLPVFKGHEAGLRNVQNLVEWSKKKGIKILTVFVFSTENWHRSKVEVTYLMRVFKRAFGKKNIQKISQQGIKIKVIGQRERLDKSLQKRIKETEELTQNNQKMILNIALSYGGRAEITEAIKNIIKKKLPAEKITEAVISENLWTSDLNFLIRTGKEQRLSNFLIWQAAYSELYFCPKYWPDFNEKDLDKALQDYAQRQRRHGR